MAEQPRPRKKKYLGPWEPARYEAADIGALQAMARGEARPDQQIRALKWIVENACKTYDMSYHPEKPLDSAFAEGKRYVGNQIVKLTNVNMAVLERRDGRSSPDHRPDPDRGPEHGGTAGRADEQRGDGAHGGA